VRRPKKSETLSLRQSLNNMLADKSPWLNAVIVTFYSSHDMLCELATGI
jgi:hypothetical protein